MIGLPWLANVDRLQQPPTNHLIESDRTTKITMIKWTSTNSKMQWSESALLGSPLCKWRWVLKLSQVLLKEIFLAFLTIGTTGMSTWRQFLYAHGEHWNSFERTVTTEHTGTSPSWTNRTQYQNWSVRIRCQVTRRIEHLMIWCINRASLSQHASQTGCRGIPLVAQQSLRIPLTNSLLFILF